MVVVASSQEQEGYMTDTRDHTNSYESPQIEARTPIDGPLIGGATSSSVPTSASFTHI
jgi:hypothetical protein